MKTRSLIFAVMVMISVSCDTVITETPIVMVVPNVGSTYTYETYSPDSLTGAPIDSTRDTFTFTVRQKGISRHGKTNVSLLEIEVGEADIDSLYLNYESNGDLSIEVDTSNQGKWFTLPISSREPRSLVVYDHTYEYKGYTLRTRHILNVSYLGNETRSVNGQVLSVVKLQRTLTELSEGYWWHNKRFSLTR